MRAVEDRKTAYQLSHSKGAQRRRRLARGLKRWDFDRQLCAEPVRRIATVTLTVKEADPRAAIGRVRDFWAKVRRSWLGTRYFCWLELQRRGAVHYHCVWLNPPRLPHRQMYAWVEKAWGGGRTQYRVQYQRQGLQREIDYALGYAKKMGKKAYQQRYDQVPAELRTFMSQRLEIKPKECDHGIDREVWQYHAATSEPDPQRPGYSVRIEEHLELVGDYVHVIPPGGRCSALDHRRMPRVRAGPRSGPSLR